MVAGTRAVELDSSLSEAYKALATAYNYKEDYESAFPLLVKSVELNPTNDQAVGNLGTNFLLRGDLPHRASLGEKRRRHESEELDSVSTYRLDLPAPW